MRVKKLKNLKLYQRASELSTLINDAIKDTREENKKKGIPNVFSIEDTIFYEMPDGKIVQKKD